MPWCSVRTAFQSSIDGIQKLTLTPLRYWTIIIQMAVEHRDNSFSYFLITHLNTYSKITQRKVQYSENDWKETLRNLHHIINKKHRGLLLVIVTDDSKILTDVIIRVTWCAVSCLVPDWPIFTRRVDLKNQVVWVGGYGLVSILGRGFRVESLRSVLLSNEFLLISALLYTLNWKSIAQEKYEPWKLNSGKTIAF